MYECCIKSAYKKYINSIKSGDLILPEVIVSLDPADLVKPIRPLKPLEPVYLKLEYKSINDIPIIDVDLPNTKEKGLILYAKGPFVLSKIEKDLGRKKWLSFLGDLYQTFRGKILTYDEFKKNLSIFGILAALRPSF